MIGTEYTVVTPFGRFVAQWDDDEDARVNFAGSEDGIAYFRRFMEVAMITGHGGIGLSADGLEPADLVGFCQSDDYGIAVFPDADDALALALESGASAGEPVLDSASPMEQIKLVRALSEATAALSANATPIARVLAGKAVADALENLGQEDVSRPAASGASPPASAHVRAAVAAQWKSIDPPADGKYIVGVVRRAGNLVVAVDGNLNRATYKAILAEADALGLEAKKMTVYCDLAPYTGGGIDPILYADANI